MTDTTEPPKMMKSRHWDWRKSGLALWEPYKLVMRARNAIWIGLPCPLCEEHSDVHTWKDKMQPLCDGKAFLYVCPKCEKPAGVVPEFVQRDWYAGPSLYLWDPESWFEQYAARRGDFVALSEAIDNYTALLPCWGCGELSQLSDFTREDHYREIRFGCRKCGEKQAFWVPEEEYKKGPAHWVPQMQTRQLTKAATKR